MKGELEMVARMRLVPTSKGGLRETSVARPTFQPGTSKMKVSVLPCDKRFRFRSLNLLRGFVRVYS
jgi:hypothetical protein